MPSDSYLRLIPREVSDAIVRGSTPQRRAFALACADLAVEHCNQGLLGLDDGDGLTLSALRDHVRSAVGSKEAESVDHLLAGREDALYQSLCGLRSNEAEAPYGEFVRLSTLRHAMRALRAALVTDGVSAAARAAFEALSATRSDASIEQLMRAHLSLPA